MVDLSKYDRVVLDLDSLVHGLDKVHTEAVLSSVSMYGNDFSKLCFELWDVKQETQVAQFYRSAVQAFHELGNTQVIDINQLVLNHEDYVVNYIVSNVPVDDICLLMTVVFNVKWLVVSRLGHGVVNKIFKASGGINNVDLATCNKRDFEKTCNGLSNAVLYKNKILACGSSIESFKYFIGFDVRYLFILDFSKYKARSLSLCNDKVDALVSFRQLYLINKYQNLSRSVANLICEYIPNIKELPKNIDDVLLVLLLNASTMAHLIKVVMFIYSSYRDDHVLNRACLHIKRNLGYRDVYYPSKSRPYLMDKESYRVSLLCPFDQLGGGSHSDVVRHHLKVLLCSKAVETVVLIFTCEKSEKYWNCSVKQKKIYEKKALDQLLKSVSLSDIDDIYLNKIMVIYAPKINELPELLGDIVFRFEGISHKLSHCIYARYIYAIRPVLTITFSSHVRYSSYTDVILSRNRCNLNSKEYPYMLPLSRPLLVDVAVCMPTKRVSESIITVYGGERIKNAVKSIKKLEWKRLEMLFSSNTKLTWTFVGASSPEAVINCFPEPFLQKFGGRIFIYPKSDLFKMYEDAYIFLALPGVSGGGGGASLALSMGIPVLMVREPISDISNNNLSELQCENFSDALDLLQLMINDRAFYTQYIIKQQKYFKDRMDLAKISESFIDAMKLALSRFRERTT